MHPLQTVLTDLGYEPRAYSGRGMFGEKCLAVDLDGSAATLWASLYGPTAALSDGDDGIVAKAIRNSREDSMGHGIVVYFPGVPFEVQP